MDLCVVIPARNEEARLGDQLQALLAQEWDGEWEIIVVDNGSTDGTAAVAELYASQTDRLRIVRAIDRADQSYAANVGVASTTAGAVAFCDADDVVASGWVRAMGDGLSVHAVVTGPNELDHLNPSWLAGSRGRSIEGAIGSFYGLFPCVRGNNYGVRSEVWSRVGPLEERFFPVADVEFSLRCWLHGVEIVGLSDAVVHYRYRQTARELWSQGFAYGASRPRIARLLRDRGRQRPPRVSGWRSWVLLILSAPTVVTRRGRTHLVWISANRIGQIVGSVRHRVMLL